MAKCKALTGSAVKGLMARFGDVSSVKIVITKSKQDLRRDKRGQSIMTGDSACDC